MSKTAVVSMSAIFDFCKEIKIIRKGENSVASGYVQQMQYDSELHTIRGEVNASMKDKRYKVEIVLCKGSISKASCNCPRGLDICHHMVALAVFAHGNLSVTDLASKWNKPKTPKDDDDIPLTSEECFPLSTSYNPLLEEISEESVSEFKRDIRSCSLTGLEWILSPEPTVKAKIIVDIEDVIFSEEYIKSTNKKEFFQEKLTISNEKILEINNLTVGQSNNSSWLIVRKHRLTASNFGKVLKSCQRARFPPSLFKMLTGAYDLDGIKQIQWGRCNEIVAYKNLRTYIKPELKNVVFGCTLVDF